MIELEIRMERLRKEKIEDIVALSSYIGWDYNREELEINGFQKVNKPPIMMKNSDLLLIRNSELYSIAAQIFG